MLLLQLPNGWKVSLSNEVYRAVDGNVYEGRGIPVQIETPVFDEADFYPRLREPVAEAIRLLLKRGPSRQSK
jgi:hypothetical protein